MITTKLAVKDRAEMRATYESWAREIIKEIGPQALAETLPEMDADLIDETNFVMWMEWAGRRLELTAPLAGFQPIPEAPQ